MFRNNKIALSIALGISGIVGVITTAHAVHVNPDGTGQVLVFPYFNAQTGYVTNINLANSTDETKAVRIRFNEGKTSKDVLDFNVYMSPQDVWTGTVKSTTSGGAVVGSVNSADRTCSLPDGASCTENRCNVTVPFTGNGVYKDVAAADTLEGFIEVIEMGVVTDSTVQQGVNHVKGKPVDCSVVSKAWSSQAFVTAKGSPTVNDGAVTGLSKPSGGLFGSSAVLNVERGVALMVNPVALENYTQSAHHTRPDDPENFELPSLASGDVKTSEVMVSGSKPNMITTTWKALSKDPCLNDSDPATGACGTNPYPVAHALLANSVMNEYFLDPTRNYDGHTDWVVTFPMAKFGMFNRTTTEQLTSREVLGSDGKPTGAVECIDNLGYVYPPETFGSTDCKRAADMRVSFAQNIYDREQGSAKDVNYAPNTGKPPRILEKRVNVLSFTSTDRSYDASRTVLNSNHKPSNGKTAVNSQGNDPDDFVSANAFVNGWARMYSADDYRLSYWWPATEGKAASISDNPFVSATATNGTVDASHDVYKGVPMLGFAALEGNVSTSPNTRFGDALPHKMGHAQTINK